MDATKMLADWRAAIDRLGPPPITEVRVGSTLRFTEAIAAAGARSEHDGKGWGSFAGIPVRASPIVPDNLAVVMKGHEVVGVINLDAPRK